MPRIGLWIDASNLDEDETIEAILDHLDQATINI